MSSKILQDMLLDRLDREKLILLASDLIKINSENPPGDVSDIADFIRQQLGSNGIDSEVMEPESGKISIISKIGPPPYLVLNGHMDTVPVGDKSLWSSDPFSGKITDDEVLGRGASDMKGGLAGILYAFIKASELEKNFRSGIMFMVVPDEETGGQYGTEWILDKTEIHKQASAALVAEPTEIDNIEIGQRGSMWLNFQSKGISAHGSLSPYVGKNAIIELFKALESIQDITKIEANVDPSLKNIIEESKKTMQQAVKAPGASNAINHVSINLGKFSGGTKVNMVPDHAEAEVDVRIPVGMKNEYVRQMMSEKLAGHDGVTFKTIVSRDPNWTSPDSKIAKSVESKIKDLLDINPTKTYQWASSDARYFRYRNVETVQYGPATIDGIHSYNESVKIKDLIGTTMVYMGVISDYIQ